MKVTIIGTIASIGEVRQYGEVCKMTSVIYEGGDNYKPLPVDWTHPVHGTDRITPVQALDVGCLVRVEANLYGREWSGKHFLSLIGVKCELATFSGAEESLPPSAEPPKLGEKSVEELPF